MPPARPSVRLHWRISCSTLRMRMLQSLANRLRLLARYAAGSPRTDSGPADVLIEVTSRCNLACPECRRIEFTGKGAHMKWSLFESALQSGEGSVEMAFLFGWGEPLLWPHLLDGIASARALGVRTSVSTNITLLKGELARRMAESGPDILTLALDSHMKQVYEHYRKGADFEQVCSNVREFIAELQRARGRSRIVLQMICTPEASPNAAGYRSFAKQFQHAEARYRRFKPARPVEASSTRRPCPVLWRGPAYVRSDGQVFPCCVLQDQPLGSVANGNLSALWNNEKMQRLRRLHSSGRVHELKECSTCYHSDPQEYSNLSALAGFLGSSYWARRCIPFAERIRMSYLWIRSLFESKRLLLNRKNG